MKLTDVVVGIDGGGSKTRAAIVDLDGHVVGVGSSGSSNYDDIGAERAAQSISSAISAAWHASGAPHRSARAGFFGMAGVRSERDAMAIRAIVGSLELAAENRIGVDHDVRTALAGGLAGQPGIAIIAGTGSSCYGRTADGRSYMCGGWSYLDDLGSSWRLGMDAMIAAVRAYDGRGEKTNLEATVIEALGLTDLAEILYRLHVQGLSRSEIAALAPMVVGAAQSGDSVAQQILENGAFELARLVGTVADRLGFSEDVAITTVGGLVNGSPYYEDIVRDAMHLRLPKGVVVTPFLPPVMGAALLALEIAGVSMSELPIDEMRRGVSNWKIA